MSYFIYNKLDHKSNFQVSYKKQVLFQGLARELTLKNFSLFNVDKKMLHADAFVLKVAL